MPENPLEGVDAPRALPADVRARIEAELLAAAPLPDQARERITKRLSDPAKALFDGLDAPRPLPARARRRLEHALAGAPSASVPLRESRLLSSRRWLAVAAAATLLLASVSALTIRRAPDNPTTASGRVDVFDSLERGPANGPGVGDPGFAAAPSAESPGSGIATVEPRSEIVHAPPGGAARAAPQSDGGAPPYALGDYEGSTVISSDASQGSEPGGTPGAGPSTGGPPPPQTTTTAPPPPPPHFRVSIVSGDATAAAGFHAYVDLLNRHGGAGGRRFAIVRQGERADAVVNLSGQPLAPHTHPVVIDSALAPDRLLRQNVFAFIGAVDRQAHLIADAVYPSAAGGTAAIYREPTGPLHDEVPAALDAVLRQRGLNTVFVDVRPNEAVVPMPTADSVFLSVSAANAKRVVDAYPARSRPPRGFNGIGTLAESTAVPDLPVGTRFISPYAFPDSNEAKRVQELTKLPAGVQLYHGWVAAKTLAVAVWRYRPDSPASLHGALRKMNGYANGFAPAYTFRPGTNSVRPEGVLFEVTDTGAAQKGGFLTDPRP